MPQFLVFNSEDNSLIYLAEIEAEDSPEAIDNFISTTNQYDKSWSLYAVNKVCLIGPYKHKVSFQLQEEDNGDDSAG